jgi:hypothetical protein
VSKEERVIRVSHRWRRELGVGELNDLVEGQPPVAQVYWPDVDKYGYYLSTEIRRLPDEPLPPAPDGADPG